MVLIPSSTALFMFGYLGSFTRFIADDYCSVYYAKGLGLVDSILFSYRTTNGRYSAYGIDWVFLNIVDAYHIHWFPPLALLIWLLLSITVVYLILENQESQQDDIRWHATLGGSLFLFLVMLLSPNIPQSFYWWNGMRSYTLPLMVLTFWTILFLLIRKKIKTNTHIAWASLLSFSLFFLSGGLSETYLVLQLSLLFFLGFLKFLEKIRFDKDIFILLAGILGSFAAMAMIFHSYANIIRRSVMPPAPNLITLLTISIESYFVFIRDFFFQKEKVFALIGVMLVMLWLGRKYKGLPKRALWYIPLSFFGGLLLLFGSFLPGVYGYAQFPPTRTLIIGVFMCVIFFLYGSFLLGAWLAQREKFLYGGVGLAIIASILILVSTTIKTKSLYESRHTYIAFAEKWDRIDAEILEAKAAGVPSITTEAMDNWAGLDRPNENPKWWPTKCYSLYYNFLVMGPPY